MGFSGIFYKSFGILLVAESNKNMHSIKELSIREVLPFIHIAIGPFYQLQKTYPYLTIISQNDSRNEIQNFPLSIFLLEREDWNIIYADNVASIFVRNTPENQYIINRYANVEKTVKNNMDTTRN